MGNDKGDLQQEIQNFVLRVLRGKCTPQETAILPEILAMLNQANRAASGN